ncbi:tetratricopeptide repeat protein [Synechococcus sp. UW140]|uniref:tetratricopeptide repeat protein n=1 Tax=Synechococcus sp. UW140 TaxID=368503 RepID=UPI003137FEE4
MRLSLFQSLLKLLQGLALGSIVLTNPLSVQADPVSNNKIIQQHVNEDSSMIKILTDKALALEKEGKNKEASEIWERIIELGEKYFGPFSPDIAPSLNKLGYLFYLQGKYNKAEAPYMRALEIREKEFGPDHSSIASILNDLAEVYRVQAKYTKSEPLYIRSLSIYEKALGPDHPNVALSLNNLAALYSNQGKLGNSEPLYIRSLAIKEKALGSDHPDVALSLNNLAELYRDQGKYSKAETLFIRSLAIYEKALRPDHPKIALSLNNLALLHHNQGTYSKAESLYIRSLAIYEKSLGADHPDVALSLNNLAALYRDQGKYSRVEPLYIRSLAIKEKALGTAHPDVALTLNNLALLYKDQGKYSKVEPLYIRSLGIYEKALGSDHPNVALSLNNLAELYRDQGKYSKAEPLYIRSLAIREKTLGPENSDVALSLNNLALLYHNQGIYSKVEPLYVRSLAIYEKVLGPDHPNVASSLNNLAELYRDQGKYSKVEPLYVRSLAIHEKVLGPDHPNVALSLNNLALLYSNQGKYGKAEPLYIRSLAIHEKALGSDHAKTASSLNGLAFIYFAQGKYGKAEPLFNRSLAIYKKAHGSDHPDAVSSLTNLAALHIDQGKYNKVEPLLIRALAIREKALGPDHPDVAITLGNLSGLFLRTNNYPKSIIYLNRSLALNSAWLNRELPFLPDQARSDQIKVIGNAWQIPFGITDKLPAAKELALNTRLNRQGLLGEIQQRQALLLSASGALKEKIQDLQSVIQQLSSVNLPQAKRAELKEQRNLLQGELYRELPNLPIETVSIADVAKALPADGVLVEFQKYQPFDISKSLSKQWGSAQYLALVLKPNGTITSINLGPAAAIDSTIHKGLTATAQDFSDAPEIWAKLSKQVLQPLLPHLSGSKQWFLSLDGELNRVPFASIPSPQKSGIPLAEAVQLRLITTGRELLRLQKPNARSTAALVMANPSYNLQTAAPPIESSLAVPAENQRRSAAIDSKQWQPLPATEQEGSQISALLSSPLLSGTKATTTALLQQQGPKVLHIATHGFFVADQETKATNPLRAIQEDSFQVKGLRQEDPQLRSGLVLAGANQPTLDPNDDGYLTSAEALNLNLKGTELVVLSACSTGQGDVRTGEGVYGLQRSLTVAGARSTLLSLWKVEDAATAEFMVRYYKRLKAGDGRSDALAAVQKEFRDGAAGNAQWKHPYYWAAWQLVGDWKPIQGL